MLVHEPLQERSKNGISTAPVLQYMSLCWQAPGHLLRAPGLGEFSKLQSLKLRSVTLVNNAADEPELLELLPALQQLTQLVLDSVLFQAPDPPAAASAHVPSQSDGWDPEWLTSLNLTESPPASPGGDDCPDAEQAVQNNGSWHERDREPLDDEQAPLQDKPVTHAACYTALLTHNKLECLEVINTRLPWQAMTAPFTEGRTSSHTPANKPQSFLKSITLKADNPSTAVEACDIEALVKSCSGLQALHISGVHVGIRRGGFGRPNFLPVLQQLAHLTSLAVSGVSDVTVWNLA
jgi:hypothetical protein